MKKCEKCNDTKIIYKNNLPYKCLCVSVEEIKNYLTPLYANALFSTSEEMVPFLKIAEKNILFNSVEWERVRKCVKSYLLTKKDSPLTHATVTPTDIVQNHINNKEIYDYYKKVDLLIVRFSHDVFNSHYKHIIPNLLDHRKLYNLKTWICTSVNPSVSSFREHYGQTVVDFISNKSLFTVVI